MLKKSTAVYKSSAKWKNVLVCVLLSLLAYSSIVKGIDDINTISLLEQKTQNYQFNFNPKDLCVK